MKLSSWAFVYEFFAVQKNHRFKKIKKVILALGVCFICLLNIKAECSYKELKELNAFVSHVETNYKYNEETGLFDLTVTNLGDKAFISAGINEYYFPTDGVVTINNLNLGTSYKYNVFPLSAGECGGELLRVLYITTPYKNNFYGSLACTGHEDLSVCNSEFLDYKLSKQTFLKLLEKKPNEEVKEYDKKDEVVKPTFKEQVLEFIENNYLKVLLPLISLILSISVFKVVLRKVKHGI